MKNKNNKNQKTLLEQEEEENARIKVMCYACSGSGMEGFRSSNTNSDNNNVAVCLVCGGTGYEIN